MQSEKLGYVRPFLKNCKMWENRQVCAGLDVGSVPKFVLQSHYSWFTAEICQAQLLQAMPFLVQNLIEKFNFTLK